MKLLDIDSPFTLDWLIVQLYQFDLKIKYLLSFMILFRDFFQEIWLKWEEYFLGNNLAVVGDKGLFSSLD